MAGEAKHTPAPATVLRFVWEVRRSIYGYHEDDQDECCIDRATGKIVVRYDLGDPANYDPNYGGTSRDEKLQRLGFNPGERIRVAIAKATQP